MKYLAAYLMSALAGKAAPSAEDVTGILAAVGVEVDEESLTRVLSSLEGKDIDELIAEGQERLSTCGGGMGGGAAAGAAEAAEEEVVEEEEEESESESDEDMGFSLFD